MALSILEQDLRSGPTENPFEIVVHDQGTYALVALAGEIDVSTVGELYEHFARLASAGVCHVSLNLAEVTFMDSTGLSVLVTEHKRAESMGGELVIFSPSVQLRQLLEIVGLDSYLNVRPRSS